MQFGMQFFLVGFKMHFNIGKKGFYIPKFIKGIHFNLRTFKRYSIKINLKLKFKYFPK